MTDQSALIDTMTGLVIFEVSEQEFCADIRHISAIINPLELNLKDNLQSDIEKRIHINNISIPLIPFNKFYGIEAKLKGDDQRILIVEPDDILFGFYVDKVKEIFTMSREFKDKLTFSSTKEKEYLAGIINYEGRTLYLPDFEQIVETQNNFREHPGYMR
ncbi:MAG: chemotaxis protein CheW [Ignavibacteriaceae bacterium]